MRVRFNCLPRRAIFALLTASTSLFAAQCYAEGVDAVQQSSLGASCFSQDYEANAEGQGSLPSSKHGRYLLGPYDAVRIFVYQQEGLSKEYTVADDGTISFSVAGHVPAAGLSLLELERSLSEKLESLWGSPTHVSVEIASRKPFFITGAVNKPGVYPYHMDLTVLHAVAVAGDITAQRSSALSASSEIVREQVRLTQAQAGLARALARRTRLVAERDSASSLEPPPALVHLVGEALAKELLALEAPLMQRRAELYSEEVSGKRDTIKAVEDEIRALTAHRDKLAEEVALARSELQTVEDLNARGLTSRSQVTPLVRSLAATESSERDLGSRLMRANVSLKEAIAELQMFEDKRSADLEQELLKANHEIADSELTLANSRLVIADLQAGLGFLPDVEDSTVHYRITRLGPEGPVLLDASEDTFVCPGDIVRVRVGSS